MTRPDAPGVARLVDALLGCTAPLSQFLDHMARSPNAPDIDAAVAQLRSLVEQVIAPLEELVPRGDLVTAAEIIERATDEIVTQMLIVPHADGDRLGGDPHRHCGARRR
jgi:hypothetical protein